MTDLRRLVAQTESTIRAEGLPAAIRKTHLYLGSKIFGDYFYQKPIVDSICSHVGSHRTFIDIGANVGLVTAAVASRFESCLAIEPHPACLARLRLAVERRRLANCRVIPCALGDRDGIGALHLSELDAGDSSLVKREDLKKNVQVPVRTLDSVVQEAQAIGPFLVKIDVQGSEPLVFSGGERTLEGDCIIVSEFWPWGLRSSGYSAQYYLEFMRNRGYVACNLGGDLMPTKKLLRLSAIGEINRSVVTDLLFRRE